MPQRVCLGKNYVSRGEEIVTTIERTTYPRFKKSLSERELKTTYTPTLEEIAFIRDQTRTPQAQLNLPVSLKCFQRLGYFPASDDIPQTLVDHMRQSLRLPADIAYDYQVRRTLYRHRSLIQVSDYAAGGEAVAVPVDELAQQLEQRQVEYDPPGPAPPAAANGQLKITPLTARGFKKTKFKAVNLAELFGYSPPKTSTTQEIYSHQG